MSFRSETRLYKCVSLWSVPPSPSHPVGFLLVHVPVWRSCCRLQMAYLFFNHHFQPLAPVAHVVPPGAVPQPLFFQPHFHFHMHSFPFGQGATGNHGGVDQAAQMDPFQAFWAAAMNPHAQAPRHQTTAKSLIDRLPMVAVTDAEPCAICQDDIERDTRGLQLPCQHMFHAEYALLITRSPRVPSLSVPFSLIRVRVSVQCHIQLAA